MKKLVFLILIALLVFAVAGCEQKSEYPPVTGKVLSAGEESILIQVTEGMEADLMQLHITDKTKYEKDVDKDIVKGSTITFTIAGEVKESEPVQADILKILKNEKAT